MLRLDPSGSLMSYSIIAYSNIANTSGLCVSSHDIFCFFSAIFSYYLLYLKFLTKVYLYLFDSRSTLIIPLLF